jgi:glycosyltransferase involved in cell wall biosynthesis
LRVNFILPGFSTVPIGGYKVAYHYANALAGRGHGVRVIHPPWCNVKDTVSSANYLKQQVKIAAGPLAAYRLRGAKVAWYPLSINVEQIVVPDVREKHIPDADATIATAWTTAPWVADYGADKGRGFYLIQHYEAWGGLEEAVDKTWRLPLHKIVIAKWLERKAADFGELSQTTYIPNGLDLDRFHVIRPIADRTPHISLLGHKADWKGVADAVAALQIVHDQFPDTNATMFGTDVRPNDLPSWIDYKQLPTADALVELYNRSSIFLHTSWSEGLPAPPAEAMACGCALVAAANNGVMDYVEDGVTALTAPIKSPALLAEQLLRLLRDDSVRQKIAVAGNAHIQTFTWQIADDSLENLLLTG